MKDIKVDLVDVEDESVYDKPDWTAVFAITAIVGTIILFAIHLF